MASAKFRRNNQDKVLFGVASGLADYFNVDPVLVRLAFVLFCLFGGFGFVTYLVLAVIMPREDTDATQQADVMRENVRDMPNEAADVASRVADAVRGTSPADEGGRESQTGPDETRRRSSFGMVLVLLGMLFLLANFGTFWWFDWGKLWPLMLVGIGVAIITGRFRRA